MKSISYSRSALKGLARLQPATRADIRSRLARFAETGMGDVKRMSGSRVWRLRAGEYRVIFSLEGHVIQILEVGHRREIYR